MRSIRWKRLCASGIGLATLALGSCGGTPPAAIATPLTTAEETSNNSDPQWVVRQESPAKVALVFVHGLFGDTISTWTNANGKRFFDLVAEDPVAKGQVDIFVFGFPSRMFAAGSFDIQAAAKALHVNLVHHGLLGYSKVVFGSFDLAKKRTIIASAEVAVKNVRAPACASARDVRTAPKP